MHASTKKAIVKVIQGLEENFDIKGKVKVVVSDLTKKRIDISYDNRKYIGRLRLELQDDKYVVYLMDKEQGKIASSDAHAAKSAYLVIDSIASARLFCKWYVILTQLAAMKRNRS